MKAERPGPTVHLCALPTAPGKYRTGAHWRCRLCDTVYAMDGEKWTKSKGRTGFRRALSIVDFFDGLGNIFSIFW